MLDWAGFQIAGCGKYLGLWIGPTAGDQSWRDPATKYQSRCEFIRGLHCGTWPTVALYNMFAVSVLQFVSQVATPPDWLLQLEQKMLRMLMSGPTSWLPRGAAHTLDRDFGLPGHFRSIKCMALAKQHQLMQHTMPMWRSASNRLEVAAASLNAPLSAILWKQRLIAGQLTASGLALQKFGLAGRDQRKNAIINQKEPYIALRDEIFSADIIQIFNPRMKRWFPNHGPRMHAVSAAKQLITDVHGRVPPCVLSSVMVTWLNGWTTGRRFQERQTRLPQRIVPEQIVQCRLELGRCQKSNETRTKNKTYHTRDIKQHFFV